MATFWRRVFSRIQLRNRSADSVNAEDELPVLESTNQAESFAISNVGNGHGLSNGQNQSKASHSLSSLGIEDEYHLTQSVVALDKTLQRKRKSLTKKLDRYRREKWAVEQKSVEVQHLQEEISALMGMLAQVKRQKSILDLEKNNKLREMALTCKLVSEDISPELRKKEPLQFKKYHSAKSIEDVQSLLHNIHLKQKALQHLEVMTFKKLLDFEHKGLSVQAKNNNNMMASDEMDMFLNDAMAGMVHAQTEKANQSMTRPQFLFNTTSIIESFGFVPASFDNPVYQSLV